MDSRPSKEKLVRQLRSAGLRVTPQRLAILEAMVSADTHPTAQELFQHLHPQLPSLSQATVYNTLQALAENGLILAIGTAGDGAVHYDGDPTPHVNLICTNCHCVEDLFDCPLMGTDRQDVGQSGFQVHSVHVAYYGICHRCQDARTPLATKFTKGVDGLKESFATDD